MRKIIAQSAIVNAIFIFAVVSGGCAWTSSQSDDDHLQRAQQAEQAERIGAARVYAQMAVEAGQHREQAEEVLAAVSRHRADEAFDDGLFRRAHAAYLEAAENEPSTDRRSRDRLQAFRAGQQAGMADTELYELALLTIEDRGHDLELRRDVARLAEDRADFQTAVEHYQWLFSADSTDTGVGLRLGISYLAIDQPTDAAAVLELVRRQQPDNIQAATNLARAYIAIGRHGDATAIYEQLLEDFPDHPGILHQFARLKQQLGEHQRAQQLRQRANEASPAIDDRDEMRPLQ